MFGNFIDKLACARKPITSVSGVTRAGVTPLSVVASCMAMTPIVTSSTFVYICSLFVGQVHDIQWV